MARLQSRLLQLIRDPECEPLYEAGAVSDLEFLAAAQTETGTNTGAGTGAGRGKGKGAGKSKGKKGRGGKARGQGEGESQGAAGKGGNTGKGGTTGKGGKTGKGGNAGAGTTESLAELLRSVQNSAATGGEGQSAQVIYKSYKSLLFQTCCIHEPTTPQYNSEMLSRTPGPGYCAGGYLVDRRWWFVEFVGGEQASCYNCTRCWRPKQQQQTWPWQQWQRCWPHERWRWWHRRYNNNTCGGSAWCSAGICAQAGAWTGPGPALGPGLSMKIAQMSQDVDGFIVCKRQNRKGLRIVQF